MRTALSHRHPSGGLLLYLSARNFCPSKPNGDADHSNFDHEGILAAATLVVDTRNATRRRMLRNREKPVVR